MVNPRECAKLDTWLQKIHGQEPPAIILGGSVNGLSFVRSLGRRGIPTLLLDSECLIGTYTRYGSVLLLPPVDDNQSVWLEVLAWIGSRLGALSVLLGTSDPHCMFIAENASILQQYFRFVSPSSTTMERIVNKRTQYGIATAAGIPIPQSYFPESVEELRCIAADLGYPCIIKPYKSHLGRKKIAKKVLVAQSQAELISEYECHATGDVPFMIQEIIPGGDDALFGYLGFWDAEGCERKWLTKRKLRQFPPQFGDGSLQMTIEAPEVAELSRRLLKAFDYRGLVGVEYKFDTRDQTYRLMEINPRTVSGNQLAISAGVDFPWIVYRYLARNDGGTSPTGFFRSGVKYVNEEWDFKAFLALRNTGDLTPGNWLRSLRGTKARAIGAWDDPLPFIILLWRFLHAFFRNLWATARAT